MNICKTALYRSEQASHSARDRFQTAFCNANPLCDGFTGRIERSALSVAPFGCGQGGSLGTIPVE